jgi:hypothetical protein
MYGLSYLTMRNGTTTVQLNWDNGSAPKLYRKGLRLAKDGAQDVCLEYPDGRTVRINRDGSRTLVSN